MVSKMLIINLFFRKLIIFSENYVALSLLDFLLFALFIHSIQSKLDSVWSTKERNLIEHFMESYRLFKRRNTDKSHGKCFIMDL